MNPIDYFSKYPMARFDVGAFYENIMCQDLAMATPEPEPVAMAKPTPLSMLTQSLVRGVSEATVTQLVLEALRSTTLEEIFVLLFQTRDIRGKGLRDASMAMWATLLANESTRPLALDLLDLVPEYGCWQDMFKMPPEAWPRVLDIVVSQIYKDELALAEGSKVSLLAKWLPREGQPMATYCAARLVPGRMFLGTQMKLYRKRIATLNRAINTVEVKMCANDWQTIEPAKVPYNAMRKYRKAFLNEHGTKTKGEGFAASQLSLNSAQQSEGFAASQLSLNSAQQSENPRNGLRYPDSDRMACRVHFQEYSPILKTTVSDTRRYDLVRERVRNFLKKA